MKRDIEREKQGNFPKCRKTQMAAYLDSDDNDENKVRDEADDNKPKAF
jgi:hypothetical protein